jgi:ribosomal protein S18 acetylase RimI-like enzyme
MRKLKEEDALQYRKLRLQALEQHPEAFAASYEEEADQPISFFESALKGYSSYYGMFNETDELIGMGSLIRSPLRKMKHKASIGSVFVSGEARGTGVGTKLLNYVIEQAREKGIEQVQLVVASNNHKAKKLYQSLGFNSFGFEEKALKIDNEYIDEEHMMKLIIERDCH